MGRRSSLPNQSIHPKHLFAFVPSKQFKATRNIPSSKLYSSHPIRLEVTMAAKEGIKRKASGGGGKDFKGSKFSKKPKAAAAVDSTKSSSAQKREVRKDRQSHRRHADVVSDAKVLWNKLRLKTNTPDENKALMDRVMELIRGKVNEIALQHDASRVVQAAIQFGNEEQRKEIMTELCDSSLPELAKIQYAHFCCLKLIKYCARDEASVKLIVKVRMNKLNCLDVLKYLYVYLTVFFCYYVYTEYCTCQQ
jgi:pumilio family protein 6